MDVVSECQQDVCQCRTTLCATGIQLAHVHAAKLIGCGTVVVLCIVSQ